LNWKLFRQRIARNANEELLWRKEGAEREKSKNQKPKTVLHRKSIVLLFLMSLLLSACGTKAPVVTMPSGNEKSLFPFFGTGQFGYIDSTGTVIVKPKYERAFPFSEGLGRVFNNGKWGFIDAIGKPVIPIKYDDAKDFTEGLAPVMVAEEWRYIDRTGKTIYKLGDDDYETAIEDMSEPRKGRKKKKSLRSYSEGLSPVKEGEKWGFRDMAGKVVIAPQYEWISTFSEGLAAVKIDGRCTYIDKTGKYAIAERYNSTDQFSDGLGRVLLSDKPTMQYAFIDKTGKQVFAVPEYDDVTAFSESLCRVKRNGKWGFIDKTGSLAIPLQYDWSLDFREGLAAVRVENAWGYIDKSGKLVIEPKYRIAEHFKGGAARVTMAEGATYIDRTGKLLVEPSRSL
jgi:hypothetical protein